jgi:hypothetical protein
VFLAHGWGESEILSCVPGPASKVKQSWKISAAPQSSQGSERKGGRGARLGGEMLNRSSFVSFFFSQCHHFPVIKVKMKEK